MTDPIAQTTPGSKRISAQGILLTGFLLAWSSLLVTFLYISQFIRLMADDFCYLNTFNNFGFWGGQQQIYQTWAGRYADQFLIGISSYGAPTNTPFVSLFLMIAWLIGLWFLCNLILKKIGTQRSLFFALVMAVIIVSTAILTMPNRFQTVYWVNGSFPYGWPMALWTWLTWWMGRILQKEHTLKFWETSLTVLLAFSAAGLSETAAAIQTALIGLVWVYFLLIKRNKGKSFVLLTAVLVSTITGLVLMAAAPGNQVRASQLARPVGLIPAFFYSFRYGLDFLFYQIRGMWIPLLVVGLAFGFLIALSRHNKSTFSNKKPSAWTIIVEMVSPVVLTYLVLATLSAPLSFMEGAYPEDRAWGMGAWFIVMLFAYLGGYWGYRLPFWLPGLYERKWLITLCAIFTVLIGLLYPIRAALNLEPYIRDRQSYAEAYDIRQSQLETAAVNGPVDLTINALQSQFGVSDISDDPANWANQCMAEFYDLTSITGW